MLSRENRRTKKEMWWIFGYSIANTLGFDIKAVSLEIDEIEKKNWAFDVWDKEISPNMEKLYIKPGYKSENR